MLVAMRTARGIWLGYSVDHAVMRLFCCHTFKPYPSRPTCVPLFMLHPTGFMVRNSFLVLGRISCVGTYIRGYRKQRAFRLAPLPNRNADACLHLGPFSSIVPNTRAIGICLRLLPLSLGLPYCTAGCTPTLIAVQQVLPRFGPS